MQKKRYNSYIKIMIAIVAVAAVLASAYMMNGNTKSAEGKPLYYISGDVVNYYGMIVAATANTGNIEVFTVTGDKLVKSITLASPEGNSRFYDVVLRADGGRLYAYAVNGKYFFKYDISDLKLPVLINRIEDTQYDWFIGVQRNSTSLITVGTKGLKVWTPAMQSIDGYALTNNFHHNVQLNANGTYLLNIDADKLHIIDSRTKKTVLSHGLVSKESHNRKAVNNELDSRIYLADDKSLLQIGFDGNVTKRFDHNTGFGYDVDGLPYSDYIYFTDGVGAVKVRKSDFKPVKWIKSADMGEKGGWSTGLNVVSDNGSEKVIVFNGTSIVLLNSDLKPLDYYATLAEDFGPQEEMYLGADKTRAPGNSQIALHGGGYGAYEDIEISLAGAKTLVTADENGRFFTIFTVPETAKPVKTEIKTQGKSTGLHYSLSFHIE